MSGFFLGVVSPTTAISITKRTRTSLARGQHSCAGSLANHWWLKPVQLSKAVIDLVSQFYIPQNTAANKPEKLDPEFRAFAIRQIRLFLFAGNDPTSIIVCYSFHLFSENPDCLARLRAEHDQIFGTDVSAAPNMLPHLANPLPYTTAVLKEGLRLLPPAGTSRASKPNQSVTNDQGNILPTDETMLFIIHIEMHRAPKYWKRPEESVPEHWLLEAAHELYPIKG